MPTGHSGCARMPAAAACRILSRDFLLPACGALFRRFGRHQHGAIAPLFALALIPMLGAVAVAVDYSLATKAKTTLDAAADAAALAAVSKTLMSVSAKDARSTARKTFKALTANIKGVTVNTFDVKVSDKGGRSAVVSYAATVPTSFMGILGINTVELGGSSTAASSPPTYIDFYLMLDNTPSMGVGATTADINTLVANTPDKCAFACHDLSTTPNDYYGLAKKLGVDMRIDVVRQATQQLMDTAAATQALPGQFRVAIYTFGASAEKTGLTTIQSLTTNLSGAKSAANAIDLMTIPYQNYASDTQTDFGETFTDLNKEIANPGSGASSSAPQKYVFFVSDGVADRAVGSPACNKLTMVGVDPKTKKSYLRCQEPLNTSFCSAIKTRGIKIAVLYTTYLPLPSNAWYNTWIAPWQSDIGTKMQECASPGFYFEVSPTEGISDAMTALFQMHQARLTK
jgi:Flp pilus assembly protein TadG